MSIKYYRCLLSTIDINQLFKYMTYKDAHIIPTKAAAEDKYDTGSTRKLQKPIQATENSNYKEQTLTTLVNKNNQSKELQTIHKNENPETFFVDMQ